MSAQETCPTKATSAARGGISGARHVEAADDRLVDAGTAKMAARLLPTLLKTAGLEEGLDGARPGPLTSMFSAGESVQVTGCGPLDHGEVNRLRERKDLALSCCSPGIGGLVVNVGWRSQIHPGAPCRWC